MSLQAMRDRLKTEITRKEEDLHFWTDDFRYARFLESTDGGPLKDVTEGRINEMKTNLERDKALLATVEQRIGELG
jgi:hypothetical protein